MKKRLRFMGRSRYPKDVARPYPKPERKRRKVKKPPMQAFPKPTYSEAQKAARKEANRLYHYESRPGYLRDLAIKQRRPGLQPYCECGEVCAGLAFATSIHHKRGRHKEGRDHHYLNDTSNFMGVCMECHNFIHEHPSLSYKRGWLLKKLQVSDSETS